MSKFIEQAENLMREAVSYREQAQAIVDGSGEEGLTADEKTEFDGLVAKAEDSTAKADELFAMGEKIRANKEAAVAAKAKPSASRTLRPVLDGPARESVLDDPSAGYANIAEFAADVFRAGPQEAPQSDRLKIHAAAGTGLSQAIGHDGGFLVPPTFANTIWDGMRADVNNLLPLTDQYTVEGESLTMNANAETSRVAGSRYGGVRGYWIAELEQITSSAPTFRQMKLEPQELAVLIYASDKLIRNAPMALEQYLTRAATEEIMFLSNDAIINGTGAGQPTGILNASCTVSVTKETGQAATTIVKENIDKMWARLHPRSWANARWFINVDCLPQLQALSQVVGVGGVPVFMPPGGISASPYGTLYGRPVQPIEYCATLGTVGDIILADLMGYATGMAGGVGQAVSMHLKFDYLQSAFRFNWALDGEPWLASAITPYKGSNTQSHFITVATRS